MKYKGFDYEDGRIVKIAYFNGYNFGDRLLEGVMFKAIVNDEGDLRVEITDNCKKYFENLNKKKWLGEALDYAKNNDIFSEKEHGGEELCLVKV